VTGYVGKRGNQNAYKMQVNTVTVGIRGTDYSARICNVDCAGQTSANAQNGTAPVAARVAVLNGDATLRRGTDKLVPLALDKPVYSGDEIRTADNGYVILVFRDNARITVNPNSQLVVSRYAFETGRKDEPNSMFIEMVKGGLRFATGLVGKVTPNAVRVRTATSTIGIRGTVFDLACAPTSASDAGSPAELGQAQCDQSLFVQTREGTVVLSGEQGPELPVAVGQNGRVDGPGAQARALSSQPEFFRALSTPEPETLQVDLDQLFGVKTAPEAAGVFVMVHEGRIEMAQERGIVSLDAGESAFAGQSLRPVKLFSSPAQIDRDPFLSKSMFNTNMCRP
jgi:hypothetical protein